MDYGPDGVVDTIATLDAAGIAHFGAGRHAGRGAQAGHRRGGRAEGRLPRLPHPRREAPRAGGGLGHRDHGRRGRAPERLDGGGEDGARGRGRGAEAGRPGHPLLPLGPRGQQGTGRRTSWRWRRRRSSRARRRCSARIPTCCTGWSCRARSPVFYSLGNFVFGGNWNPRDKDSVLVKARFDRSGYLGRGADPAADRPLPGPAHPALPAHRRRGAGGAAAAADRVGDVRDAAAGARAGECDPGHGNGPPGVRAGTGSARREPLTPGDPGPSGASGDRPVSS